MKRILLYDIDSKIPNLALMRLSAHYKKRGYEVILSRRIRHSKADKYFASSVFYSKISQQKIDSLKSLFGNGIDIGGSGVSLEKRLTPEIERCFPDYQLYNHKQYAVGCLTRGCNSHCPFCLVSKKEGRLRQVGTFEDFVPEGQRNILLLDDNLLAFEDAELLLSQIIEREYAVNFSQSLDIAYLNERKFALLKRVNSRNAKFNKWMIYFSCNNVETIQLFIERKSFLQGFGKDAVTVITMYGFNTKLSEDYERMLMIRKLRLVPFFQRYLPIPGVPERVPDDFFDIDLGQVIRLTFRSNGQNWEKYLRWVNRRYFCVFGRYYLPLVKIIYRYNYKEGIHRFLRKPEMLTTEMYKSFL